jgi:hypothetical protein
MQKTIEGVGPYWLFSTPITCRKKAWCLFKGEGGLSQSATDETLQKGASSAEGNKTEF